MQLYIKGAIGLASCIAIKCHHAETIYLNYSYPIQLELLQCYMKNSALLLPLIFLLKVLSYLISLFVYTHVAKYSYVAMIYAVLRMLTQEVEPLRLIRFQPDYFFKKFNKPKVYFLQISRNMLYNPSGHSYLLKVVCDYNTVL